MYQDITTLGLNTRNELVALHNSKIKLDGVGAVIDNIPTLELHDGHPTVQMVRVVGMYIALLYTNRLNPRKNKKEYVEKTTHELGNLSRTTLAATYQLCASIDINVMTLLRSIVNNIAQATGSNRVKYEKAFKGVLLIWELADILDTHLQEAGKQ